MRRKIVKAILATTVMTAVSTTNVYASTINDDCVNVRTGNDTSYSVIGQLPYGAEIEVVQWDVGNGWCIANTPFGVGYISNTYVSYDEYDGVSNACAVANQYSSSTDKLIVVDTGSYPRVYVFTAGNGWELLASFDCSVGKPETPTPTGVFSIQNKRWAIDSVESWEYFMTDFLYDYDGSAWGFHSTLFAPDTYDAVDDRIGCHISNGCIRLRIEDAQWLWENCGVGSTIVIQ